MELLEAKNASISLKESVSEIITSNKIPLDSKWQDYEVLNAAIKEGNKLLAYELLEIGCRVNNDDISLINASDTPLHNAVKSGDIYLVMAILKKGASIVNVDCDDNTPLHLAFLLKHYKIVDIMLIYIEEIQNYDDMTNKDCLTHLHIVCAQGDAELAYNFIRAGADINCVVNKTSQEYPGYTCLQFACDSRSLDTIKVVSRATELVGFCLRTEKDDFHMMRYSRDFARNEIDNHHIEYLPQKGRNKILLSNFQRACFDGDVDKVRKFIENGQDVNVVVDEKAESCPLFTPLHLAFEARQNRQKVVELLLEHGADVTWNNGFCTRPLHRALYSDPYRHPRTPYGVPEQDNVLKLIYEAVKDKESNPMDAFGLTYFHAAVAINDLEMVRKFIEAGQGSYEPISPNWHSFIMYHPIHFAVKYGHEEMVELLIQHGADVNANSNEKQFDSPLQVAIKYGQCKMIDFLLARGADAKIMTYFEFKSTLHLIVERFGDYEDEKSELLRSVDTLIRYGVNVDSFDYYKHTVLHCACWEFDRTRELVYELLNQGADINIYDKSGDTAFERMFYGYANKTVDDYLSLYYYVMKLKELGLKNRSRNDNFCKMIMNKKNIDWKRSKQWATIEQKCNEEELTRRQNEWNQEIDKLKIDMLEPKVSVYDYLRLNAKMASKYSKNERLENLIADKQLRSIYPFYGYLIPAAHRKSLPWLKPRNAQYNLNFPIEPVTLKLVHGKMCFEGNWLGPYFPPKRIFISNGIPKPNLDNTQKLFVKISLQDAIKLGSIRTVKQLLIKGASTKFIDNKNNGPLHIAFIFNYLEIVDLLLSHMKKVSEYDNFSNNQGLTQLQIAASRGNVFIVKKLLEAGANPEDYIDEKSPMYAGYTALQFACDRKCLETVRIITTAMEIYGNITEDIEESLIPSSELHPTLVNFMTKLCQDKERLSTFHETCLSSQKSVDDLKDCLDKGVDLNAPMNRKSTAYSLHTALHFAVDSLKDRQKKVELLLKRGANITLKNALGMTPLHLACYNEGKKDKSINLFDRRQKDNVLQVLYNATENKEINPMDAFGLTYFHIAITQNDLPLVKTILLNGEDANRVVLPNIRAFSHFTPLHFTARYSGGGITELLIEHGAKVYNDDHNPKYRTPLQIAITYGNHEVVDVLLKHGANTKVVQPSTKQTTLHLLVDRYLKTSTTTTEKQDEMNKLEQFVEKLVKGGADVNALNSDGFTVLQNCCANLYECSRMVRLLLLLGADINLKVNAKTALDFANESEIHRNYDDFFMLYEHVQQLKTLGLKVDPQNDMFCDEFIIKSLIEWTEPEDVKKKYENQTIMNSEKRLQEIEKLKKDMLTDEVSMYDYIRMDGEQAAAYLDIERLQKIDSIVEAQRYYKIFGYLIPCVYRKGQKWYDNQKNSKDMASIENLMMKLEVESEN